MPYFAYIVGGWVQKEGKFCLRNKSMAPKKQFVFHSRRKIEGVATLGSLKAKVLKGNVLRNDPVTKATYKTFKKVTLDTTLEKLNRILDKEHFALVVHSQRLCKYTGDF